MCRVGLGVRRPAAKNDKSFNTAAWRGLERARDELGVDVDFIEPTEGNETAKALLRSLAAKQVDLVIGVGFVFGPTLERLAGQYPDVNFAGIDYSPARRRHQCAARTSPALRFREHEGSLLVSAIAAPASTRTKIVGFVGGMEEVR